MSIFNIIIFSLQEDWRFVICYTTPGGGRHPTQIQHWSLAASPRHVLPAQQSERWGSSGSSHSWMEDSCHPVCYLLKSSLTWELIFLWLLCGDDKLQSYDFVVSCELKMLFIEAWHFQLGEHICHQRGSIQWKPLQQRGLRRHIDLHSRFTDIAMFQCLGSQWLFKPCTGVVSRSTFCST